MAVLISTGSRPQANKQNAFRPIYYLGCKTSFAPAIEAAIDEVDPSGGRLVDLFSGTGAVGAALGATREVTTVDVQEYSRVLCSAVLNPPGLSAHVIEQITTELARGETTLQLLWCLQPLIDHERYCIDSAIRGDPLALIALLESPPLEAYESLQLRISASRLGDATQEVITRLQTAGLWRSANTTVARNFGGVYFSFQQATTLDATLSIAEHSDEHIKDTLMAASLSTASSLVNTVGKQFAQPIQPRNKAGVVKPRLAKTVQKDRTLDVVKTYRTWLRKYAGLPRAAGNPRSLRLDYLSAMEQHGSSFSVVYADPPYTRDHYSRFYHVLETMCLRDNPKISRVSKHGNFTLSRGVYRENRHQSPFCIRSEAPAAFSVLFKTTREHDLPLVLSYSPHETGDGTHPRVVSMEQIVDLARTFYDRIEVCVVEGVTHNKLNSNELKLKTRDHAEILLKCFR